jgi:hypothetical protein
VFSALVLLFIQMGVGFPIEQAIQESKRRADAQQEQQRKALIVAGGNPLPAGFNNPLANPLGRGANNMVGAMVRTHYTPWFWIWLVFLVGSLGPLVGELIWAGTSRPARPRRWRRPAYADDY